MNANRIDKTGKWLVFILVLWFLFTLTTRAEAQMTTGDKIQSVTFAALQAADFRTTRVVVGRNGGTESNAAMRGIVGHPVPFAVVKGSVALSATLVLRHLRPKHPKLAQWAWVGLNLGQGFVVYHNWRQVCKK
jgi:hypothetical protein